MARGATSGLAGWWQSIKDRASQAVSEQEANFVRGKVAGTAVTDDRGQLLVDVGQRIDAGVIARARQAGKMAALARAAALAQTQDLKENVQSHYARTETGQEARLLESVEEFRTARTYLGRILTMDVTDIRGNVIVPGGKKLDDEDIRRARDAGLLSALLVVAEQAPPAPQEATPTPPMDNPGPVYIPPAPRQAPILLTEPVSNDPTADSAVSKSNTSDSKAHASNTNHSP